MAKVLIVDDAIFMRMTIKKILEENGHSMVGEAITGVEAIEKFAELKPDVVLLDISMPEMNGLEALKRIRILDPKAQVIICSALGQQDFVASAIENGAKDFIVKPFTATQLVEAVEKVLKQKK